MGRILQSRVGCRLRRVGRIASIGGLKQRREPLKPVILRLSNQVLELGVLHDSVDNTDSPVTALLTRLPRRQRPGPYRGRTEDERHRRTPGVPSPTETGSGAPRSRRGAGGETGQERERMLPESAPLKQEDWCVCTRWHLTRCGHIRRDCATRCSTLASVERSDVFRSGRAVSSPLEAGACRANRIQWIQVRGAAGSLRITETRPGSEPLRHWVTGHRFCHHR
jgi:hypothetical protein